MDVDYQTTERHRDRSLGLRDASGNLSFAASATTATVQVQIQTDRRLEHRERFFLSLINPSAGAAIEHGQASGLIRDDDTWTRFISKKVNGRIRVSGRLSPAHPGKLMVVTLTRMRNGVWVRLGVRRPVLIGGPTRAVMASPTVDSPRSSLDRMRADAGSWPSSAGTAITGRAKPRRSSGC